MYYRGGVTEVSRRLRHGKDKLADDLSPDCQQAHGADPLIRGGEPSVKGMLATVASIVLARDPCG